MKEREAEKVGDCPRCGKRSFVIRLIYSRYDESLDEDVYGELGECYNCGYFINFGEVRRPVH